MRAIAEFGGDRHHRRQVIAVEQTKDIFGRERRSATRPLQRIT